MKIYLVGGAVRDMIMGVEPKDKDYVIVGATQDDEVKMISDGFQQVGQSFPVYLHPTTGDEYAFARVERKTGPGHQGFEVATGGVTLEQDLSRRDLTMNSMAMDLETGEIIDPFGGQRDIQLRTIRNTTEAFAEDPLRIFRAAKFMSRYNFMVHPDTTVLMKQLVDAGEVAHLAKERIVAEMINVVAGANPTQAFDMLASVGALRYFSERIGDNYDLFYALCSKAFNETRIPSDLRIGFFMGSIARSANNIPTDDQFRKEMINMKLSTEMMQAAIAYKAYGQLHDFESMNANDVIPMLKRLGFMDKHLEQFNTHYFAFCIACRPHQQVNQFYMTCVHRRCVSYAKKLSAIDREAISLLHGKNGKAIGAAIREAEIAAIHSVDEIDASKPEGYRDYDVVTNRPR